MGQRYFAGLDVGSATIKTVLINELMEIVGSSILRTSIDIDQKTQECYDRALKNAGINRDLIQKALSTGFGRDNSTLSDSSRTEISCLSKGAYHYFPEAINIVDIGGQDNKMIRLDADGRKIDFQMNRKCAAGTGAFLEEIANRFDLSLDELEPLARKSTKKVELGSYCTVFTFTEMLSQMKQGVRIEDLVWGVFFSIVKRIFEFGIVGKVVLTGGVVEYNRLIAEMLEQEFDINVLLPPSPQLVCAFGAALYSREFELGENTKHY